MTGRQAAELIRRHGEPVSATIGGQELVFDAVIRPAASQDGQLTPTGFLEDCLYMMYAPPGAGRHLQPGSCLKGAAGEWMVRRVQPDSVRGEVICVRAALSAVRTGEQPGLSYRLPDAVETGWEGVSGYGNAW